MLEQRVVVVEPSPPLPVVTVRDVELRARVALRRIGALEGRARFDELVAPEEGQAVVERLLVDVIDTDAEARPPVT